MASVRAVFQAAPFPSLALHPRKSSQFHTICTNPSHFLSSESLVMLKNRSLYSSVPIKRRKDHNVGASPVIYAAQVNFLRVMQTVWKVGRDGVEAGTNLVPVAIPRPFARTAVAVVVVMLALFVLKSLLSTAFFVLAVMGLSYFTFIAFNKDEGAKGGGERGTTTSVEDSLEESRRIMDKYK